MAGAKGLGRGMGEAGEVVGTQCPGRGHSSAGRWAPYTYVPSKEAERTIKAGPWSMGEGGRCGMLTLPARGAEGLGGRTVGTQFLEVKGEQGYSQVGLKQSGERWLLCRGGTCEGAAGVGGGEEEEIQNSPVKFGMPMTTTTTMPCLHPVTSLKL